MINIHARVKHLIEKYNTRDPLKIISHLGIKVNYDYLNETKGFYIKILKNKFIIINSLLSENEKRIVLAHELGHALLHNSKSTCYIREYTLFPRGRHENEANKFAAELLINEKDIDKQCIENMTIEQLAYYYGVPKQLIAYKFHAKK